jgi:CheY-like chemotaxis protein
MTEAPLVLCADDDEDILSLVALRLQRAGYRVETATDGARALERARELEPDLIVLDVMMPRMTGVEVLTAIRAEDALAATKVILLSARVQEADIDRGMGAGADAYLAKPFRAPELVEAVERLLGGAG